MRDGADKERLEVLGRPDEDMAARYKKDPRITPVGRVLRRFSIDELPQLLNVIRGEMSLVGPRPMLEEEVAQLEENHQRRHLIMPGLTGLWQISGRKETSWEERMLLDLYYIDQWSISTDIAILLKTFKVVVDGRGSY
jgi:lipopolysaccharide/colanic/teichoic acid biosynthesis glycosyltransferase